jgi:hypothetical protein
VNTITSSIASSQLKRQPRNTSQLNPWWLPPNLQRNPTKCCV